MYKLFENFNLYLMKVFRKIDILFNKFCDYNFGMISL